MGVEGHEVTGVVGERMRVRSRQPSDQDWIVPTAGAVLPTADSVGPPIESGRPPRPEPGADSGRATREMAMGKFAVATKQWQVAMASWAHAVERGDQPAAGIAEGQIASAFTAMGAGPPIDAEDRRALRVHDALDRVASAIRESIDEAVRTSGGTLSGDDRKALTISAMATFLDDR